MPDISVVLKVEIVRLARKEVYAETDSLEKTLLAHRKEIAALKRRIETFERQTPLVAASAHTSSENAAKSAGSLRFCAEGFAQHCKRLRFSALEMGLLLGASPQSVYKWESNRARRVQGISPP